jgi:ASC-1-like (ASCH) protein
METSTVIWFVAIFLILVIAIMCGAYTLMEKEAVSSIIGGFDEYKNTDTDTDTDSDPGEGDGLEPPHTNKNHYNPVTGGANRKFRLGVREPWFEQLTKGKATVVGRLRRGVFAADARTPLKAGDPIVIARSRPKDDKTEYPGARRYQTVITHVTEYPTFARMLKAEGLEKVFPGAKTETAALKEFSEFYSEADQQGAAVVAIGVKAPSASDLKVAT